MKSSFKKLPGSKIALEVTLDPAEFKQYYDAAEAEAFARVEIKGFRKGTAPRELAETALDKDKVFHAATEEAVRRTLHDESEAREWTLIDTPKVAVKEASPGGAVGLRYEAELTLFPEIRLGNYKKISGKIFSEKKEAAVSADEIEKSFEWLRESRATIVRTARGAEEGDLVDIDFEGFSNGKALPGVRAKGDRFILGKSSPPPGFDEKLKTRQAGDALNFSLVMPKEHWNKELAGHEVGFKGKVNVVYERTVPAADDAFAKSLGSHFKNVAELKESVRDGLRAEKEEKERERLRIAALDAIAVASETDVPDVMIEKTIDRMIQEIPPLLGKERTNEAELRVSLRERARENVLRHLVLHEIARAEHLEPTPEEVAEEAKKQKLDPRERYDYSYEIMRNQKVFSFLESQAHA